MTDKQVVITETLTLTEALAKQTWGRMVIIQVCGHAINASDIMLEVSQRVMELPANVKH